MAEQFRLPPDFEIAEDEEPGFDGDQPFRHRASGKLAYISTLYRPPNQDIIDYTVRKMRFEYRRDRLFAACGKDIDRFRQCQIAMRERGYMM